MNRKLIDRLEPRRLLAILYVDWNAPYGTNDGSSWDNALHDLHDALAAANSGDTIRMADGTHKPTKSEEREIAFELKSGVGLYGGYAGYGAIDPDARDFVNTPTILTGEIGSSATDDNSYHVINGNELADLVTIDGFTVTQTRSSDTSQWGAIKLKNVNLTVRNLNAISNKNSGISFESDAQHKLQVYDSNFSLNTGGVSAHSYQLDHLVQVDNCTFTQNGSGLVVFDLNYYPEPFTDGVAVTMRSSHFDGNGNGAYINARAGVFDCTFNNNSGTGLYVYTGLVTNSEFNDNGSNGMGSEESVTVINSEFCRNGGHAASWFQGMSFRNCRFIGNALTALVHSDNSDSTGGGVYECLFVGNPTGVALNDGSVSRSVFIGNGTAIKITELYYTDWRFMSVSNNTFYANTAETAAVVHQPSYYRSVAWFERNIAWNNGGSPDLVFSPAEGAEWAPTIADSIIDEGYADGTNISTIDPQFIEEPSPGADGVWGTEDDDYGDLHLQDDSPALNWGYGAYADVDVDVEHFVTLVEDEYVLTGTEGDDTIRVSREDYAPYYSEFSFRLNGSYESVIAEFSLGVRVNAGNGNDRVTASNSSQLFTLDGGAGNDTLSASRGGDVLIGGEGDDELNGYCWNGFGGDTIFGGDGNDKITIAQHVMGATVDAGDGNDRIIGSDDVDLIHGGAGNDYILANEGNDTVYGGDGKDTLTGSAGRDQLYGQNDADRISGGKGIDAIFGGSGEDRMYGNDGNDYIEGGGNVDRAWGGAGNDTLIGGGSNDKLYGEAGNDRFYGNAGADLINGGPGTDAAKVEDDENLYLSIESYF